ncbi:MAG: hypothetical protein U5K56_07145 [Halioglobus sp.]|nr:hypothetical protein [Halioglobus sp.]
MIADKWGFSREQMEEFALRSHTLALKAIEEGRFDREVAPLNGVDMDETPRNTSMEAMADLEPWRRAAPSPPPCPARPATAPPPCCWFRKKP